MTCATSGFHPGIVLWRRNGELLSIDGHNYETEQILNNQENSVHDNNLTIRDTIGLINNPTYTCEVSNGNTTLAKSTTLRIGLRGTVNNAVTC